MDFQNFGAETSTLIGRLLANQTGASLAQLNAVREALDAAARALQAPAHADRDIDDLARRLTAAAEAEGRRIADEARGAIEAVQAELRTQTEENGRLRSALNESGRASEETRRALDSVQNQLKTQFDENSRLAAAFARAEAETALLRSELQTAHERAEAAERDLVVTVEAHGEVETALRRAESEGRQAAQARDHVEQELAAARSTIERALAEGHHLRQQLEGQHAASMALQGETSALQHELAQAAEVARQRDALQADLQSAGAKAQSLERDLAAARTSLEHYDATVAELELSRARVHTLQAERSENEQQLRQLQGRLDEALQAESKLREAMARATETVSSEEQNEALRWELERMVSLFDASVRAVQEMANARTSGDLLSEIVKRLSIQFSRVALFRVKGNALEGDQQIGFEDTDITKIVLPATVDSLLTRAMTSRVVESMSGSDISKRLGLPLGGAPTSAVALPLMLQGTALAVVYADDADMPDSARGPAVHESSVGFAKLLAGEASVLLMSYTQELKMLAELRQYATTLLQEAKEMYLADAQAGKPAAQLRARLKDNLECASQLYTYRAAMEGTAAAALLDEQIATEMAGTGAFARDLAGVVSEMAASDLSLTAEAS